MTDVNDDEGYVSDEVEYFTSVRRPALLTIRKFDLKNDCENILFPELWTIIDQVSVLVWPNPTPNGGFIVEHTNGKCEVVPPYNLTFLDSEKEFNQYNWNK